MWPTSPRFLDAITSSNQVIATKAEILEAGLVIADLTDVAIEGSVTADRAAIRRRCTVSFTDLDGTLSPEQANDLLSPYGNELRPWRGIRYPDGTSELVPLGTMVITRTVIDWPRVTVEAYDRAFLAQRAKFESPFQVLAGTNYGTALQDLLANRLPSHVEFAFPSVTDTSPMLVFDQFGDPWQEAQEIAAVLGMQLYFDQLGVATLAPEPDLTSDPTVAAYAEDPDRGVLLQVANELDAEQTFNVVVATGESSTLLTPVRGIAEDADPTSPTYTGGKFGRRVEPFSNPLITSTDMADRAARTRLLSQIGITQQVTLTIVPNPAHEVSDLIYVRRPRSKVDAVLIADAFTVDLRATAAMPITTRARQAILETGG